jgi:hypothetical protein
MPLGERKKKDRPGGLSRNNRKEGTGREACPTIESTEKQLPFQP